MLMCYYFNTRSSISYLMYNSSMFQSDGQTIFLNDVDHITISIKSLTCGLRRMSLIVFLTNWALCLKKTINRLHSMCVVPFVLQCYITMWQCTRLILGRQLPQPMCSLTYLANTAIVARDSYLNPNCTATNGCRARLTFLLLKQCVSVNSIR